MQIEKNTSNVSPRVGGEMPARLVPAAQECFGQTYGADSSSVTGKIPHEGLIRRVSSETLCEPIAGGFAFLAAVPSSAGSLDYSHASGKVATPRQ